jgi:hypothetical protein
VDSWRIEYRFFTEEGRSASFFLAFDAASMQPLRALPDGGPDWCKLACERCPACRLPDSEAYCPAALRLAELMAWSAGLDSWLPIRLEVQSGERLLVADTTAQRAVSSLMGLLLATSGCPDMDFLKPMARFHLPLADETETAYRAASMYLLAQYFAEQAGRTGDFELRGLHSRYQRLQEINRALNARVQRAVSADSAPNAVVILDCFAKAVPGMIDDALPDLAGLFTAYLRG